MARSRTSQQWLKEHVNDHYVHLAKKEGYRARAAYKLLEIHEKDKLFRPGMIVVDLGAAPGSWSQVASHLIGTSGKVFALDVLPMEPIKGVRFIQGDFREETVLQEFVQQIENRTPDLVISDMAPNITGMRSIDQPRSFLLSELALEFADQHLKPGGHFLVKVFQGADYQPYLKSMHSLFCDVVTRKPKASRDRSNEIYLLGKNRR